MGSPGQCKKWACNESANTCYAVPDPSKNNTSCNDGAYCTKTDKCNNGTCKGTGTPCSGNAGQCKKWFCNEGTNTCTPVNDLGQNGKSCSDGQYCTKTDTCATGLCVGSGSPCSGLPPSQCLKYVCNEPTDSCNQTADPSKNGSSCNDGKFCTKTDTCSSGTCSGSGSVCAHTAPQPRRIKAHGC